MQVNASLAELSVETSIYGILVVDAGRRGFNPTEHHWLFETSKHGSIQRGASRREVR